ncbi:MAG: MFS transporter [Microbacterium sp.]|nr:MFS transporter [Microbacterium sp.]MBA4346780.1 MFS transporter [Microbacterium sp.]
MSATPSPHTPTLHVVTAETVAAVQRRTRGVLMAGQVLAGLGMGATLSIGAILAADISGSPAFSGMAATAVTLGAALTAIPLARLARRAGRAPSLATGALAAAAGAVMATFAAGLQSFPLLLLGILLIGSGTAVNLQSRFAAVDLAAPSTRGRDLSLVVWATTVGAVSGPNLIGPGETLGAYLGMPELTGPFLFTMVAQSLAAVLYLVALRPDPLALAAAWRAEQARVARAEEERTGVAAPTVAAMVDDRPSIRLAMLAIALSHATMVAVMAMTPVHLTAHGASLVIVGFTISLHIAGMYALSPVFGIVADRVGRRATILMGQGMLAASLLMTGFGAESQGWVVAGLIFLGLGWSASTVAGSALLTESAAPDRRTIVQGRSDLVMSGTGALGGALAGVVLALLGYNGLSFVSMALVMTVVIALVVTPHKR